MKQTQEEWQKIIDCCGDPIVVYDKDGLATYTNPAFERVFGWRSDEVLGNRIDFVPKQAIEQTKEAVEQVVAGKAVLGLETVRKTKDKKKIHVRLSADALKTDDGQFNGIVVTLQDITDLVQSRYQAFAASKAKSDFLSNVSHEIRTPMNGILGMIDLLINTRLNTEQQEFAEVLKKSAAALMVVVSDILDFSRIESGEIDCDTIDFDLRTTMDAVKKAISPKVDKKGLSFFMSVDNQVPSLLKGDPERLRQILRHLLENAVKFTDQGEIKVLVGLEQENLTRAFLNFEVADTGIGIEKDQVHTIFQSFSQADGTATRKYGGTGIGLSISTRLVYLMGGKIDVQSTPGQGSVFRFALEFEKQSTDLKIPISIPKTIKDKKMLIVDDTAANRLMLKGLLNSWGCVFEEAATAERALEKLALSGHMGRQFDIVLMDMQMPGMDGETLAGKIRSNPDLSNIILIMLSSMGKRGDVARLKKIGVQGYLPKPVNPSLLFDCITTALAMQDQETKDIITRHSLKENKKQQVRILMVEPGVVNGKIVKNILNKSGYSAQIAADWVQAKEAFQTGLYTIVLLEADPMNPQFSNRVKQIQGLGKNKGQKKITLLAMTEHDIKQGDERMIDDYIQKPVMPDNLLAVIEKWTGQAENSDKKAASHERTSISKNQGDIFNYTAALERAMDDKSFLEMLLTEFSKSLPEKLAAMKGLILKNEHKALSARANSLRGSASNIGADGISAAALELEKNADIGDIESMHQNLGQLENEYQRFKKHINTIQWGDA
ncbi:MAG: response regulator [Proteobacteria bacterium]|nr:response regulator [Pseudomonadota bacterium]MBU1585627.1 response regulator [Pseudomonadota bacterium]MBU2452131.1 response regulator [Pseudomonadota bacterium]MBU2631587.1 response regulator [Pseudomonadota bacterium]